MSRWGRGTPAPAIVLLAPVIAPPPRISGTSAWVMTAQGNTSVIRRPSGTSAWVMSATGDTIVTGKPGQGSQELIIFDPDQVLTGGRITYYRFDLLDADENLLGQLIGVTGGEVDFDAYASVKSTGNLEIVTDPRYTNQPEGQPAFLGEQSVVLLGRSATAQGTAATRNYLLATSADATDISIGDRIVLTDSTGVFKEQTVFTVSNTSSASGYTSVYFTPDAADYTMSTDRLEAVSVEYNDNVDWLNVRIRPTVRIARLGGGDDPAGREVPVGVFLAAAPVDDYTAAGLIRRLELADKLSILDQDIASGDPAGISAFSAGAGENIIDLVIALIDETGEKHPAIQPDTPVLAGPMVWDIGTTRLKVINDLLDAAGYFSLFCDGQGQYQAVPYVQPDERDPVYAALSPFSKGPDSLMDPAWTRDRDIYSVPNRFLVVGQGDGENEALTSVATNTDPASVYSFPSRGRWVTEVEIGVEAINQAALDLIARARLSAAMSVTNQLSTRHVFLPDLKVNSVVHFVNPDAGLDIDCYVVTTTIPFDPTALCSTTMRLVT
jgi:hypothetical protein